MEVKVLLENTRSESGYKKGHGLALLIGYQGRKYLFDTGPNRKYRMNGEKLGESLTDLTAVILSHGHCDHTGGLRWLPQDGVPIFAAAGAIRPHYLKVLSRYLYVGMSAKGLAKAEQLVLLKAVTELAPGCFLVPMGATAGVTKNLYKDGTEGRVHDDFADELMLVLAEDDGLLVFTGCSHHGIVEMAETALALFPGKKIKYLIGGFHMIGLPYLNNLGVSQATVKETALRLKQLPVEQILTGHCTGPEAFKLLQRKLGSKIAAISTGQRLVLM